MFLQWLEEKERVPFLALAKALIAADGVVHTEEQRLLSQFAREMGIELPLESVFVKSDSVIEHAMAIESHRSRYIVLLELIGLGYVDQEFHPEESKLIREIAMIFGINNDTLKSLESWVLRQLSLFAEAQAFWAGSAAS